MKFELKQQFRIESARRLVNLSPDHPCSRLHGHSFAIYFCFAVEKNSKTGWTIDYHEISEKLKPVLDLVDHRYLNDVKGLENPTSENLCEWFFIQVKPIFPQLKSVSIQETPTTECIYSE